MDYEREKQELDELRAETHGLMKDLGQLIREAQQERERTLNAAIELTESLVAKYVEIELEKLGPQVHQWSQDVYKLLNDEAHKVMKIAVYGNAQGRGASVFDQVAKLRELVEAALEHNTKLLAQAQKDAKVVEGVVIPEMLDRKEASTLPPVRVNRAMRRRLARKALSDKSFVEKVINEDD